MWQVIPRRLIVLVAALLALAAIYVMSGDAFLPISSSAVPSPAATQTPTTWDLAASAESRATVRKVVSPEPASSEASTPESEATKALLEAYRSRQEGLPSLMHKAIISKKPADLEMAQVYMRVCQSLVEMAEHPAARSKKGGLMTVEAHTALGRYRDGVLSFCSHIGPSTMDFGLLNSFLTAVSNEFGDAGNSLSRYASSTEALKDAASSRNAEVFMHRYSSARALNGKEFHSSSGLLSVEEQAKWPIAPQALGLAMMDTTCERWGCDEKLLHVFLCHSYGACGDESYSVKLQMAYEQQRGLGPKFGFKGSLPDWSLFIDRSDRYIAGLGRGH